MALNVDDLPAEVEALVEEWSSNTTECFSVDLLRGDGSAVASFEPEFTYPIFGEEERIFGYQDLSINLAFAAHNLRPHLEVSYGSKFAPVGEVKASDIYAPLRDFLPESAFSTQNRDEVLHDAQAADFVPPGEKIYEYSREEQKFEIWCASLANSTARQLLENMQVLIPLFIEGGSMLQLEHDWSTERWKLYLLYQVLDKASSESSSSSPYSLVGYGTTYRVFAFPTLEADRNLFLPSTQSVMDFLPPLESNIPNDLSPTSMPGNITSPLDLPSRERLSQFLILPPFQRSGHGQELYNTMYTHLTSPQNVRELTVEDPNEGFDDLRDLCDLLHLRAHIPEFAALRINTSLTSADLAAADSIPISKIIPQETRDRLRAVSKIMPRQLDRLIEMHTLSFIPPLHRSRSRITRKEKASNEMDRMYYLWRLYVKERLYIFNRDQLVQLDREERVEKLESAVDSVLEGYVKMLERVETREQETSANGDVKVIGGAPQKGKRKMVVVDDEDDEVEQESLANGHKKARIEA